MLTLLFLALLSWSCGRNSQVKETTKANQEKPPINVVYNGDKTNITLAPTVEQEYEVEIVPRPQTADQPIIKHTPASKVVIKEFEEVVVSEVREARKIELENENVEEVKPDHPPEILFAVDHSSFSALLEKYVDTQGKVNYPGLKSDVAKLDNYLRQLKEQPVDDAWSRNEKLAYWINAYNAFTLKLILNNYPLSSITDLEGGKPWDKKWIDLGDKTYSLNQIENDIIRPRFNEPRIHFAVNCAAKSCPPLANKAFTASNLEGLLESQTKKFINNTVYNKLAANQVQISKLFDWYGSDFGTIISFLNKYATVKINDNATVDFMEYNWSLNN